MYKYRAEFLKKGKKKTKLPGFQHFSKCKFRKWQYCHSYFTTSWCEHFLCIFPNDPRLISGFWSKRSWSTRFQLAELPNFGVWSFRKCQIRMYVVVVPLREAILRIEPEHLSRMPYDKRTKQWVRSRRKLNKNMNFELDWSLSSWNLTWNLDVC